MKIIKAITLLSIMFIFCLSTFAGEDEQLKALLEKYSVFMQQDDIVQITAAPTPTHVVNVMPVQQAWAGETVTIWGNSSVVGENYEWDFDTNDATPVDASGTITTSNQHYIKADRAYTLPTGVTNLTYTAKLTIKDSGGTVLETDQVNITVIDKTSLTPNEQLKVDVNIAIENGLEWLYQVQDSDGSWAGNGFLEGPTGYVTLAFLNQGYRAADPAVSPAITDKEIYAEYVYAGLNYLFTHTRKQTLSPQTYGDPDPTGEGGYYYYTSDWNRQIYETGMALMAIASTGSPGEQVAVSPTDLAYEDLSGKTYKQVAEGVVRYLAWAQNESGDGRGGWRYHPNYQNGNSNNSDNSNAQWPVIGMQAAEHLFSIAIPPFVKSELSVWINSIQKGQTSAVDDGGSGYTTRDEWDNTAKTGALIAQMELIGDTRNTSRVLNAMDFIERHWNDATDENTDPRYNKELKNGNYYAIYSVFKGLFNLKPTPGAFPWDELPGGLNWRNDLDQYLISGQNTDGSWPSGQWFDTTLSTAAAVLSLMRTVVGAPFVTINESDITGFPTIALNIFVDSDAGISGRLINEGQFEIVENDNSATITNVTFDNNTTSYNLEYTSPNTDKDGTNREVLVRVTDPEKGVGFKIMSYTAPLSGVIVSVPDSTGKRGQAVVIPVNLSYILLGGGEGNVADLGITSVQFKLKFDHNFLIARRLITASTVTEMWGEPFFHISSGEVEFSMAGADALTDSGALAKIKFDVLPTAPLDRRTELDLVYLELNEGNVDAKVFDGVFYAESCIIGDVNGDEEITREDADLILKYLVGENTIPNPAFPCFTLEIADVSNNGMISALDAHLIMAYIAGVITEFPRQSQ